MDRLKVLMLHGNFIRELPRDIGRLSKIEEFGLEWWQYLYIDEVTLGMKDEGVYRDETIVTNRQTLRQIFETVRQLNAASNAKKIEFPEFFRQFKRIYT